MEAPWNTSNPQRFQCQCCQVTQEPKRGNGFHSPLRRSNNHPRRRVIQQPKKHHHQAVKHQEQQKSTQLHDAAIFILGRVINQ